MMDKKRKFELNTEEEQNHKTFKSNRAFDDSFSKTASSAQKIKCLICAGEIPLRSESETHILQDQVSTVNLLGQLFKVLKLSPEVCRLLLEISSSKVTVLYCESCEEAVSSCLKIAQEIHHLQDAWEKMSNQIKENIIKDHQCRLESSGNAFIRKTLVQCWTTCTVRIKQLPLPLLPTNKSENHVDADVDTQIKDLDDLQLTMGLNSVVQNKRVEILKGVTTDTTVNSFLGPRVNLSTFADVVDSYYCSEADVEPGHHFVNKIVQEIGTGNQSTEDDKKKSENRVTLRPRRCTEQTANYLCDIKVDENLFQSDTGSEYAPDSDSPLEEEEEKIVAYHDDNDEQDPFLDVVPELASKRKEKMLQCYETSTVYSSSPKPGKISQRPVGTLAGILKIETRHRHQEFPFHCSICGKGYHKTKKLKEHEEAQGNSNESFPFTCFICTGQRFKSTIALNIHIGRCHKKSSFPGSGTDAVEKVVSLEESKAKVNSASEHKQQEHSIIRQIAGELATGFPGHPNTDPDTDVGASLRHCKKCSLTFKDTTTLREHIKSSHGHPRYVVCPECPERFSNIIAGRIHQLRIHGKSLKTSFDAEGSLASFLCVYCKEEFVKSSFMTLDNSTDPPTNKFSFPDLPLLAVAGAKNMDELLNNDMIELFKSFHWNHRLYCKSRPRFPSVADKLDVSNSVKHACKLCPKEFSDGNALRNHEVIAHTKDFKFYCEVCGSPFSSRGRLNSHHRTVHGEKQFKCERCPKIFKTSSELKGHINTHNNIRPFVCDLCGKAYCTRNVLYMHKHQSHKK